MRVRQAGVDPSPSTRVTMATCPPEAKPGGRASWEGGAWRWDARGGGTARAVQPQWVALAAARDQKVPVHLTWAGVGSLGSQGLEGQEQEQLAGSQGQGSPAQPHGLWSSTLSLVRGKSAEPWLFLNPSDAHFRGTRDPMTAQDPQGRVLPPGPHQAPSEPPASPHPPRAPCWDGLAPGEGHALGRAQPEPHLHLHPGDQRGGWGSALPPLVSRIFRV